MVCKWPLKLNLLKAMSPGTIHNFAIHVALDLILKHPTLQQPFELGSSQQPSAWEAYIDTDI